VVKKYENHPHDPIGPATEHPPENGVSRRRRRGINGGKARAAALTPEQRSEIARIGAQARWKKSRP
jgi:hypothetical protein